MSLKVVRMNDITKIQAKLEGSDYKEILFGTNKEVLQYSKFDDLIKHINKKMVELNFKKESVKVSDCLTVEENTVPQLNPVPFKILILQGKHSKAWEYMLESIKTVMTLNGF